MAGVAVHRRERQPSRPEGLLGQAEHDRRVLPAREEEDRVLELGRDLPQDVDRLGLEGVEVRQLERHGRPVCPILMPSRAPPAVELGRCGYQRPAATRGSWSRAEPSLITRVRSAGHNEAGIALAGSRAWAYPTDAQATIRPAQGTVAGLSRCTVGID